MCPQLTLPEYTLEKCSWFIRLLLLIKWLCLPLPQKIQAIFQSYFQQELENWPLREDEANEEPRCINPFKDVIKELERNSESFCVLRHVRTQLLLSGATRCYFGKTEQSSSKSTCQHPDLGLHFFINCPTQVFVTAVQMRPVLILVVDSSMFVHFFPSCTEYLFYFFYGQALSLLILTHVTFVFTNLETKLHISLQLYLVKINH